MIALEPATAWTFVVFCVALALAGLGLLFPPKEKPMPKVTWYRAPNGQKHAWKQSWDVYELLCEGLAAERPTGRPCSRPSAGDRCDQCHQAAQKLGR